MRVENENGLTVSNETTSPIFAKNICPYFFARKISLRFSAIFKMALDSLTEQSDNNWFNSAEEYSIVCGVSAIISQSADTCNASTIRVNISRERLVFPFSISLRYGGGNIDKFSKLHLT